MPLLPEAAVLVTRKTLPLAMTMKLPLAELAGLAAATRSMESVAERVVELDLAGLTFQIPSSLAAKPACGRADAKMSAARVAVTARWAVEEIIRVIGASIGWAVDWSCRAPRRSSFPMLDGRHDGRRPS